MKETKRRKKLGNKGFSIVELLIVMAIMAILTGAIAPQVTKYVEKAREAKDLEYLQTVFLAAQVAIVEESVNGNVPAIDNEKIEDMLDEDSGTTMNKIAAEIIDYLGFKDKDAYTSGISNKFKSKASSGAAIRINYDNSTNILQVYVGTDDVVANAKIGPITNN